MKITIINATTARKIEDELGKFLKDFGADLGLIARTNGGTYGMTSATFKVEVRLEDPSSAGDMAKKEFEMYAPMFGLSASDFGKTIMSRGTKFTICGIAPKSHKYPILAKHSISGKIYKFRPEDAL